MENVDSSLKHLVVIPDGNGRWAQKHSLDIWDGHLRGAQRAVVLSEQVMDRMDSLGIDVFSFWGFSTENWIRSDPEVYKILEITESLLEQQASRFIERGLRFRHIGRRDNLPSSLLSLIGQLEERTSANSGKTFVLALDYGGRDEIVRAVNKVTTPVDEASFKNHLDTAGLPDPDLIIRTAGEMRTSGMMPYQGVYAEFISSPVLFPDFTEAELDRCLGEFFNRKRRFGGRLANAEVVVFDWLPLDDISLDGYLQSLKPHLNQGVSKFINLWRESHNYNNPELSHDIDKYQRLLTGGKKLRAALVILGFENFNGEPEYRESALLAAVGYETIHNAFLIHDDIEDNSETRRGDPSIHKQYQKEQEDRFGKINPNSYGIALALNTGSLGPIRAQRVLWQVENKQERIVRAQQLIAEVVETTMQGQRHDLTYRELADLSEQEVYRIYSLKTAFYSVIGPFALGAILAGASKEDLKYLTAFGSRLGIAFQIVDDDLGMYGDPELTGKPVGSDLAEAKKTLLFVRTWQKASSTQRRLLERYWGEQTLTQDQIEQVRGLMNSLGTREEVLSEADHLADEAKLFIPRVSTNPIISKILNDLANFVAHREI